DIIHGILRYVRGQEMGPFSLGFVHGQLSSAVMASGILMVAMSRTKLWRNTAQEADENIAAKNLSNTMLDGFTKGMVWASMVLGIYLIVQFLSGFDFFSEYAYRQDRRFESGFYRVTGLTTHPVTMAGQSLATFVVFWAMAWVKP